MEDKRKRSRSYPGYGLEECIHWATKIRRDLGAGPHDRESLARALGSTGLTGASTRKIGAMVHFGLLDRQPDGYTFSRLSERILKPLSDSERQAAEAEAFMLPELYAELIARFEQEGVVPARLANILVRDHGIEDVVAQDAAKVFLSSGRFAGIIDDEGRIARRVSYPKLLDPPQRETVSVRSEGDALPDIQPVVGSEQQFRFSLTHGRTACLTVPPSMTPNDVRLLQKQIEFLALQAELGLEDEE